MHIPPAFAETDLRALDQLIARAPFITLVTIADGLHCATPLPALYRRDGARIVIEGHWASVNPQAWHRGPALLIVHGPHAYVSPGWYPDKETMKRVTTWNYATAHLHGHLQSSDDEALLADVVARLSERQSHALGSDWRYEPHNEAHRRMLRSIVGFRFEVERVELKLKLSQNHAIANQQAVHDALQAQADPSAQAVVALMRQRLPPD
ncbi:FMN-binding negative transcriptional regulator [Xanthomonas albilineans]|uniref:Putative transcriptional regulator transcription regulator protein n=1 Tax=Xanthomonas albilineans (strain GPE PC73 / CFBP 7063) TaxID=380358 RepID=D2UE62_XANAP|nr:FMN-binding negative transcriptional regulator [Xanthomonas albilineans]QHQ28472.1 putative transcriptional regulator transcription regulator protein [Xanthomonas albilineans]CBA16237.1 putative transcriptional regulator transcription regulator protein [Xanthomonas albilineans GPE PC73]